MSVQDRVVMNDAAQSSEIDLGAVGRALARKKWWVFGPALAVAALTFVGVNLITPKYKSEARILIEGRENIFFRPDAEKSADRDRTVDQEAITSQVQLALSRDVARQVIKDLKLGDRPEFDPTLNGVSLMRYSLGFLGLARDPLSMTPEERVLEAYFDRLTVFPVDKSRVFSIEFQSADPELAAKVANAVADSYLKVQQSARQEQTRAASRWLGGEIDVLRKRVSDAEEKVEGFRSKTNLFAVGTGSTLSSQTLGEANRDLAVARSQKADLESKARYIRDVLKRGGAVEYSDMINSELIRRLNEQRVTLRAQLAEQSSTLLGNHPRIKELKAQIADLDHQIRDEAAKLARSFENDAQIAGARMESLQGMLDQLKLQASSTNGQDVELRALDREAKSQRDLLESYLAKYREAIARDNLSPPGDARVISPAAVSNTPYFPKKLPIVLIATLATLLVCAGFITTGELLAGNAERVVVPMEPVEVPVEIAEAPARRRWLPTGLIRAKAASDEPVDEIADEQPPVVEAGPVAPVAEEPAPAESAPTTAEREDELPLIHVAQALREAGDEGKRIAVMGAELGSGATRTAVALARLLARDARVVLLEMSLDRPELAAITLDPRSPGIGDLVHGSATFGEIITRDRVSRVQIIPAGDVGMDTAMVYGSERLVMAIDALMNAYDHIVIDVGAVADAPVERIARLAPCGLLVAGKVSEADANETRERLLKAGFGDIAVFTGTPPALDDESVGNVAA